MVSVTLLFLVRQIQNTFGLAPEDVTQPGLTFALRPGVHAVAKSARAAARRGYSPHRRVRIAFKNAREDLEAGTTEYLRHVLHLDRVAKVWLVGTVQPHRLRIGDEREFLRHRLAAELLEHAAHHRLDRVEHVLLRDEAHLEVELVEFTGRTVGAGILVAEAGC